MILPQFHGGAAVMLLCTSTYELRTNVGTGSIFWEAGGVDAGEMEERGHLEACGNLWLDRAEGSGRCKR